MTDPRCLDCRFWRELPIGDPENAVPYIVASDGTGLCRRYPPAGLRPGGTVIADTSDAALAAAWQITWNFDWCGEFVPAPANMS